MDKTAAASSGGDQPRGSLPIPKSRRGLKGFFAEVGREMKKVSWPSRHETNRLTGVVLSVCGLVVAILYALSLVFDTIIGIITRGSVG